MISPRIAIFHDNFAQSGGAERVAESIARLYPQADLYTSLCVEGRLSPDLKQRGVRSTWMQYLPFKKILLRHYFLLYPLAVESVNLRSYDLVISSCFGYAKGVRKRADAIHICYCHTPMRWVWRTQDYMAREQMNAGKKAILRLLLKTLKRWEMAAARRPDVYIANSQVVAERLQRAFGVTAEVVPPPVDTRRFQLGGQCNGAYLVVSRLTAYKRIDLAVQACTALNLPLRIVGGGPDLARLRAMAGPTVTFLGRLDDEEVGREMQQAEALIFPGEEDFGITPLEANACGTPVIAFAGGGALETIVEGVNGVFFSEPTAESMQQALAQSRQRIWNPEVIRERALRFDESCFHTRLREAVDRAMNHCAVQQPQSLAPQEVSIG